MRFQEAFRDPPAEYRIKPFWFWNGEMTREEISHQIQEMADKGLGGMFICARQGMTLPYLSKEWFDLVEYAWDEAKRLGLEVWLYDEYPYPSGMSGGEVLLEHPEAGHTVLRHRTFTARGGETLTEEIGWGRCLHAAAYPVDEEGETDWNGGLELTDRIGCLQTEKIYQKTGLTKYNNKRFFSYGPKKILKAVLPDGRWRVEVYTEEALGDFKYYGGFFDPCSREAVKTFLETTHERYRKAAKGGFDGKVKGIFSDEVGLLSPIPWSKLLPVEFERKNGYSVRRVLPALHDHTYPDACRIRYDLYHTIHELFVESYHRQTGDWCRRNRLAYATEVPSMRMGTQKYSDIIGGDTAHEKLGKSLEWIYDEYIKNYRSNAKAVSSLSRQLGRKYAMIESFHSVGWTMTLQDAKWMIDRLGSSGINFYNFHAFYYTIADITKHDAPPSQFLQNPYWRHYRKLSDYVGRMGAILTNTEADIKIAVLNPDASLWTVLANPFQGFSYAGESEEERARCEELRDGWVSICKALLFHQMDYDHLDGEMLGEAEVENGEIHMGRASYSTVIIPPCHCMEAGARRTLEKFAAQGGCIIAMGQLPDRTIDRDEDDGTVRRKWRLLLSGNNTFSLSGDLEEMIRLCRSHVRHSAPFEVISGNSRNLLGCVRMDEDGERYVFAGNQGVEEALLRIIPWENGGDNGWEQWEVEAMNLEDGALTPVSCKKKELLLPLGSFESQWLRIRRREALEIKQEEAPPSVLTVPMEGLWTVRPEGKNLCRFAAVEMSLDGRRWEETETETFVEQCAASKLLEKEQLAYSGTFGTPKRILPAYPLVCLYRAGFTIETMPDELYLLMDKETAAGEREIRVNKIPLREETWNPVRVNDQNNRAASIRPLVREGENQIEIRMVIRKDEEGLRDPFYLWGSFGVSGGERGPVLTAAPDKGEPERAWCGGYPYYSGAIVYEKAFTLFELAERTSMGETVCRKNLSEKVEIRLGFQKTVCDCIEVSVNGNPLGVKAFTPYRWNCDKKFLRDGENRIQVTVTNTLANMLDGAYFDYEAHRLVPIEP